jgi:hypothetical protein
MLEQLGLLALGWLGGILSPALVEAIKAKRETEAVLAAAKGELNEVAYRLVLASYNVSIHLGSTDRQFLKWVQDSMILYHGGEPKERIAEYIADQLSWTDEALAAHVSNEAAKGVQGLVVPKFSLPFSDARTPSWHSLPASVRLELLAIHTDIRLLNDVVDQTRMYFNLTFTKLEGSNPTTVVENLRGAYDQYGKRCRIAADRMHRLQLAL